MPPTGPRRPHQEIAMSNPPLYLRPGRIGTVTTANRVVRAATSETMATPSGAVLDSYVDLYRRLAAGGAGLILTGHMYVDPRGQASRNQTGIHDDRVVPALRRATGAVHEAGGLVFAQLGHCGSQTMMSSITAVAPSPVPNAMYARQPEGLSEAGIWALVRAFGDAARRAREAGFDGVHIHGGNGYLISEFCSPHANTREDGWGGDAERRSRFFIEVYEAVRAAVGTGFPVTARLSVEDSVPGGLRREESFQRARLLAERGIDGLETTFGVMRSYVENIRPYVAVGRRQA
ncbi:MAG: NADH:flavin oxidoreductase [Acidimicrobiia bacterium]|nr:NADH:flavin oxidoreductase [Acidimicrobiia bacterium]